MWYDILQSNIVAGLAVGVLLLTVAYLRTDGRNLPPGPRPWPVVGNLPSLSGDVEKAVEGLRRRYGNVFRLYMGSQLTVFVNGYEAIKDVLLTRGEEFADRPSLFMSEQISKGKGLALTSGELWKQQRRFALHTLRDFGLGKSSVESKILEEAETLIKRLEDTEGGQIIINKQFHTSVSNVICSIVFGIRFDEEDPEFKKYVNAMEETISSIGVGALNFMPWLKYLPGDLFNYHSILRHVDYVENFINEQIREHKNTLDPDNPRDFIDAYLVEMSAHVDDPNSFFEDEQLVTAIGDLFAAGTETTSTTLRWAMLYLINYPDVQAKLRTEIHSVVGKSRLPSVKDRKFMPYTEAVIMEIQRCGDISFMGVPHAPIHDTTLNGFTIPKGTAIIPSMVSIHKGPEIWPNPEQFNPDRFLDSDGHVVRSEYLMPFGAGKRVCLGESLARMEIFLFLVAILQRFKVKPPEGVTSLPDSPILGLARSPRCFPLRLELDI